VKRVFIRMTVSNDVTCTVTLMTFHFLLGASVYLSLSILVKNKQIIKRVWQHCISIGTDVFADQCVINAHNNECSVTLIFDVLNINKIYLKMYLGIRLKW
jgi:hypothetical protein